MPIIIATFTGEIPRLNKRLLPDAGAQTAINCYLETGTLAPIRQEALVHTFPAPVNSFVRHDGEWLGFDANVFAAPGPVADDRLYYTGDGTPKLRESSTVRELALPAPSAKPVATPGAVPGGDPTLEATVFVYTCVTDLGEESAPSPASDFVNLAAGQSVTISNLASPTASRGIEKFRLYRSQTSISGVTSLYFVKEIASTQTSSVLASETLGEQLSTTDFDTPVPSLKGLIALPNGMMAAFRGRELMFCEPYLPHAWPAKYRLTTDYPIVGLAAFGTTIAVMTEGMPYRVQGTAPENMQMDVVEQMVPCLATKGIVDMGYAAAYPSSDGLVLISSSGAQNATQNLFTRDQWAALNPSTFVAGLFNGSYVFSYIPLGGGTRRIGIINVTGSQPFFVRGDMIATSLRYDVASGDLFALIGNAGIYRWHDPEAPPESYDWRSKVFTTSFPTNFGCLRVEGEPSAVSPTLTVEVYADGALVRTINTINQTERMPGGFLAEQWEIRITGNAEVHRVVLATTMSELGQYP